MRLQTIREIVEGATDVDLTTKNRKRHVVLARFMYFELCRKHTDLSLNVIGKSIGKDHSTVVYGLKAIKDLVQFDRGLRARFSEIKLLTEYALEKGADKPATLHNIVSENKRLNKQVQQLLMDNISLSRDLEEFTRRYKNYVKNYGEKEEGIRFQPNRS